MRNNISRKLSLNNMMIVLLSLIILFVSMTAILWTNMKDSFEKQLQTENLAALRMSVSSNILKRNNIRNPNMQFNIYDNLSESTSLSYVYDNDSGFYILDNQSKPDFVIPEEIDSIIIESLSGNSDFEQISIEGIDYLYTSSVLQRNSSVAGIVVVSFISMESLNDLISQYMIVLLIVVVVVLIVSALFSNYMSTRITKPLAEVIRVTEKYAENDFSESYVSDTGDEVEDLSRAVSAMGNKLKDHNEQREKTFRYIAHEVKTPLTAIYGYAEGIKRGIYKENDEALDIIMEESIRIKQLTEDMIFLSKLESRVEEFEFEMNDISSCVERAIRNVESTAILNDIDIFYEPRKIQQIIFDDDKIYRALLNLLSNCLKYTKDVIIIRTEVDKDEVTITVSDNGPGMDEKVLESLNTDVSKEKNDGSGIGLKIVREIVVAHGGRFTVANDVGAVFKIILKNSSV